MKYTMKEVLQYLEEEDVKFIRLAFCDVFGKVKNISINPCELEKAFDTGIPFDRDLIDGFSSLRCTQLCLKPDPSTLAVLPWRPEHGRVVRMYSDIYEEDGKPFRYDMRHFLAENVAEAKALGLSFSFTTVQDFYLFDLDEAGKATFTPFDNAGYMDLAPEDRGENVRREICLSLSQMGIQPQSSHHGVGPGQNRVTFKAADPVSAADNSVTFMNAVKTIAYRNGLSASFSPLPLAEAQGNSFIIRMDVSALEESKRDSAVGGVLKTVPDMTLFFNPDKASYRRLAKKGTPNVIGCSPRNYSQIIRYPVREGGRLFMELRSPDSEANPYLAIALLVRAAVYGVQNKLGLNGSYEPAQPGTYSEPKLPADLASAAAAVKNSLLINRIHQRKFYDKNDNLVTTESKMEPSATHPELTHDLNSIMNVYLKR